MKKQSMIRKVTLLVVTVLIAVSLSGCSNKTSDTDTSGQVETTASVNYPDVHISTSAPTAETVENTASPSPDEAIVDSMEEEGTDQSAEANDLVSSDASDPEELEEVE